MQPVNPITNIKVPARISSKAGSSGIWLNLLRFWNMSFSVHAHNPIPSIKPPNN